MRVLMVASECYPLVKTGGLADVVGALPGALAMHGCETRVLLPNYPEAATRCRVRRVVASFAELFGGPARLLLADGDGGPAMLLLDAPHLFGRAGNPYLGPDGKDWPDNDRRFAALGLAAAQYLARPEDGWRAEVVHCHDWQAGLVPVYLHAAMPVPPPVVFTIHNIAFPGFFRPPRLRGCCFPRGCSRLPGLNTTATFPS